MNLSLKTGADVFHGVRLSWSGRYQDDEGCVKRKLIFMKPC